MIIREFLETREDGVNLYRTYSDKGVMLRQIETGALYSEPIDVENAPYTYEETEEVIEKDLHDGEMDEVPESDEISPEEFMRLAEEVL